MDKMPEEMLSRRHLLGLGAAGLGVLSLPPAIAHAAASARSAPPARPRQRLGARDEPAPAAAPTPGRIPWVDSLAIQVLVDAATFGPFLPDLERPGLTLLRRGSGPPSPTMSRRTLQAEFGLSLLATSRRGGEAARVLIDFGYAPETIRNNLELLGIDTAALDAAVLSHGHLDHYGGFAGVLGAGPAGTLPLYVGGEETFCERVAQIGTPPPLMGSLDRAQLAGAGFAVRIVPAPHVIQGQAFTTGTIPLAGFERAAIPTRMRPGKGCDRAALDPAKGGADELADDGAHELATCYAVKGLGLVVIASCSHRGVINSIRQAQRLSGIDKVHAVVGGFHLVRPRTEEEARRTVAELAAIDPAWIVPMHCTGEVFIAEALRRMPDKVVRPYVGNQLIFAA